MCMKVKKLEEELSRLNHIKFILTKYIEDIKATNTKLVELDTLDKLTTLSYNLYYLKQAIQDRDYINELISKRENELF